MQLSLRNPYARSTMLAALSSLSILAHGQDAAKDYFKDLQYSGFLDIYYQYSGNNPPSGAFLPYRNFDVRDNSFSIAAALLSISKPTSKDNPFGFTVNLLAGKDADIETAGEPNDPNGLKWLHQGYVTYATQKGLAIDLGKFQTWIGLESPFAVNNDLYSLSFVFTLGQPIYHVGLRATQTLDKSGTTVGLYGVNGWNEAEDSNRSKSYGASLAHTFGKVAASLNYYGGNEGSPNTTNGFFIVPTHESNVQLGDFVLSSQLTPKIKLAANFDYADVHGLDSAPTVQPEANAIGGSPSGHYASYDVVGRYQFSKTFGAAVRYDNFWDYDGTRSGLDARFNSVAGVLELTTGTHSVVRFEVRNDQSNRQAFENDNGNEGRRARTTFTLAHIFKF